MNLENSELYELYGLSADRKSFPACVCVEIFYYTEMNKYNAVLFRSNNS